jgi:glycosyltransferase involved in cell wall biosynthesis
VRILQLSQFYPPVAGGVEVHVASLATGLAERGHQVVVGTLDGEDHGGAVAVHVLPSTSGRIGPLFATERHHAPPVPDPETSSAIARLVRAFRPDIVHAHDWLGRSYLPVARRSPAALVRTLHDCGLACAQGRRMFCGAEYCSDDDGRRCKQCTKAFFGGTKGSVTLAGNRLAAPRERAAVDLFLPVSRAVAEANRLEQHGARFRIVPNFVTEQGETAIDDPLLDLLPDEPYILQVGDAVTDKGVFVLFEAYRRLESPPPLVLIGRIEPAVREQLPEGALALGVWPHALLAEAWRRSLFGTVPSLCLDACPTVTMEAMAAGKAVIASRRGGLTDQVVDGETGLLVEPGDIGALASAMETLIHQERTRERMGGAGRVRLAEHFRDDVVIDRVEGLYESLLA